MCKCPHTPGPLLLCVMARDEQHININRSAPLLTCFLFFCLFVVVFILFFIYIFFCGARAIDTCCWSCYRELLLWLQAAALKENQ